MKTLSMILLLLFGLFLGLGLIFWGIEHKRETPKVRIITPTPTATPSATPTPQIIFRNVPNSNPVPTSGQQSAQPSGGSSQNGQPQTINNNTTVQQQPNPQPPPAPTQAPQPTPTPGLLPGILDLLL